MSTILLGKVARELELEKVGENEVGKFSVAVSSGEKDAEGNYLTTFFDAECWSKEYQKVLADKLKKGETVILQGHLAVESFERKDGTKGTSVRMVNPDIRFLGKTSTPGLASTMIAGRVTSDIELKTIEGKDGKEYKVARFSVADNSENKTSFFEVECWNKQAEVMNEHLAKGSVVSVKGDLKVHTFEREDGSKGKSVRIVNPNVNFLSKSVSQNSDNTKKIEQQKENAAAKGD